MGSCASKYSCCIRRLTARRAIGGAAVHPWTPPEAPPPGHRVTVRMRAGEFRALAALRRAAAGKSGAAAAGDDGDVGQLILDGCAAGRWTWSPAPPPL